MARVVFVDDRERSWPPLMQFSDLEARLTLVLEQIQKMLRMRRYWSCIQRWWRGTGKSCLLDRYVNGTWEPASKNTVGAAFSAKKVGNVLPRECEWGGGRSLHCEVVRILLGRLPSLKGMGETGLAWQTAKPGCFTASLSSPSLSPLLREGQFHLPATSHLGFQ